MGMPRGEFDFLLFFFFFSPSDDLRLRAFFILRLAISVDVMADCCGLVATTTRSTGARTITLRWF